MARTLWTEARISSKARWLPMSAFKALLQGASAGYFVLENLPLIGSLVYSNQEQLRRDIAIRLPYALCNIALLLHGDDWKPTTLPSRLSLFTH